MTADHTMTDTTKPTGDTIDDAIMELANIMCGEPEICEEHWGAAESAIKAGYRRLAERPNRAVARGEIKDALGQVQSLWIEKELWPKDPQIVVRMVILDCLDAVLALTTPTETTDPTMERDDAAE